MGIYENFSQYVNKLSTKIQLTSSSLRFSLYNILGCVYEVEEDDEKKNRTFLPYIITFCYITF